MPQRVVAFDSLSYRVLNQGHHDVERDDHIELLGVIYMILSMAPIVVGVVLVVPMVSALVDNYSVFGELEITRYFPLIGVGGIVWGALSFVTGAGLHLGWPVARWFGWILGAGSLLLFPVGTLVGAYTLWALTGKQAVQYFDSVDVELTAEAVSVP